MRNIIETIKTSNQYQLKRIMTHLAVRGREKKVESFLLQMKKDATVLKLLASIDPTKKVSEYVAEEDGVAGINGGFYFLDNNIPLDYLMVDGDVKKPLENLNRPCLCFKKGGVFIVKDPEDVQRGFDSVLQVGPMLVWDSEAQFDFADFHERRADFDCDITVGRNSRAAFAMDDENYYFVTVNGRLKTSAGFTLHETARFLQSLGVKQAINLDGGGSTTLIVDGKRINHPRKKFMKIPWLFQDVPGGERKIPNAVVANSI